MRSACPAYPAKIAVVEETRGSSFILKKRFSCCMLNQTVPGTQVPENLGRTGMFQREALRALSDGSGAHHSFCQQRGALSEFHAKLTWAVFTPEPHPLPPPAPPPVSCNPDWPRV